MQNGDVNSPTQGAVGIVIGAILVVLGTLFFAGELLSLDLGEVFWPFFIIVPGLAFLAVMALGDKSVAGLAIPGCVITTVGLILFTMNMFGHWESWAYAWALIPTAVGVGITIMGSVTGQPEEREAGIRVAQIGLVLFVAFGVFFELVVGISGDLYYRQWVWPILLIAVGLFLIVRRALPTGLLRGS